MIDHYVMVEMLRVVNEINPGYPGDIQLDANALRKIGDFIAKQLIKHGFDSTTFMDVWRQLYTTAYNDPFYSDKSLATISNHIQEFFQKTINKNGKVSGSQFKDKLASRLNKKR